MYHLKGAGQGVWGRDEGDGCVGFKKGDRGRHVLLRYEGGGGYSFIDCLGHLIIGHASL